MVAQIVPADSRDKDRSSQTRAAARALQTGRTSAVAHDQATTFGSIKGLYDQYAPLGYELPFEALGYIELIARYNPDYSQAVANAKTLANSGHNLFVDASSSRRALKIKARLEEKARLIQKPHGGIDGLIEKLLDQAVTFGAMCGEWVLSEDLTDVVDFVDINPKVIRFFWEEDEQKWAPYQKVNYLQVAEAKKHGQKVRGSCVKLNEQTFHYFAFNAAPSSPYGTPPFIAALGNIAIQRDMVYNMAQIVKKVGLLGIIDLTVESLRQNPGEADEDFILRATQFLDQYKEVAESMVRDGGIIHFDDVTVQTTNIAGNAAGATAIFKQNEELIFSGLQSMPSVQGRSYSTTETYAGVAYDIIIRNTHKYQRAVKRMIEAGYFLMTTLWNDTPDSIRITFKDNKTLHRLQDAQSEEKEIQNALVLWWTGMLDQVGFGQRMGFSEPKKALDEPPADLLGYIGAKPVDEHPEDPAEPPVKVDEDEDPDDKEE